MIFQIVPDDVWKSTIWMRCKGNTGKYCLTKNRLNYDTVVYLNGILGECLKNLFIIASSLISLLVLTFSIL